MDLLEETKYWCRSTFNPIGNTVQKLLSFSGELPGEKVTWSLNQMASQNTTSSRNRRLNYCCRFIISSEILNFQLMKLTGYISQWCQETNTGILTLGQFCEKLCASLRGNAVFFWFCCIFQPGYKIACPTEFQICRKPHRIVKVH